MTRTEVDKRPAQTLRLSQSLSPDQLDAHRTKIASSPNRVCEIDGVCAIGLTQGHIAITDLENIHLVNGHVWHAGLRGNTVYAVRMVSRKLILMHRVIASTPDGLVTDHIDRNGLNNLRSNLRNVMNKENMYSQLPAIGSLTGHRGIFLNVKSRRYYVSLKKGRERYRKYSIATLAEAIVIRDQLGLEAFGENWK